MPNSGDWLDPLRKLKIRARRLPGYWIARLFYHSLRSAKSRREMLLLLRPPQNLFQPFADTEIDRYPLIFRMVREQIGDGADRLILSFGCASGEEVFSLRRYFPQAAITGIDINPRNIALCRARQRHLGDQRMAFVVAGTTAAEASARYDAIFAMAVFRHGDLNVNPPLPRCDHRIRFADFERTVSDLARCLKPGGLLAIRWAQFRFNDTTVADGFTTVMTETDDSGTPLYGRGDLLLESAGCHEVVFRKHLEPTSIPAMPTNR